MRRGRRPWKYRRREKRFRKSNPTFSEHHLVPRSQGGEDGPTITVRDDKHKAWHLLTKNKLSKEAANMLSVYLPKDERLFAFNKNTPISDIIDEINEWKGCPVEESCLSEKIIQFYPKQQVYNFPELALLNP